MYDPDIDHLVNSIGLPQEIWRHNDLMTFEMLDKIGCFGKEEDGETLEIR